MKRFPKAYALSIATGGFLLMAAPAIHAENITGTPQQVAQAAQTEFGDQQLQQYAEAVTQIRELNVEWQQRIQKTEDPGEAQEMRQAANEEMIGAIRDEGLTLEEYNQITTAATNDPELRNQIAQYLE